MVLKRLFGAVNKAKAYAKLPVHSSFYNSRGFDYQYRYIHIYTHESVKLA